MDTTLVQFSFPSLAIGFGAQSWRLLLL
uniref:Uncharacterized protein n=1 Tax=Arundo donax TaxID=35708 RepID=A0A0A9BVL5_ARUDO